MIRYFQPRFTAYRKRCPASLRQSAFSGDLLLNIKKCQVQTAGAKQATVGELRTRSPAIVQNAGWQRNFLFSTAAKPVVRAKKLRFPPLNHSGELRGRVPLADRLPRRVRVQRK